MKLDKHKIMNKHKIMVLKPANKNQIILDCHNFENILNGDIQHHPFLCGTKAL